MDGSIHKQSDRQFVKDTPFSVQSVQSSRSYGAGPISNLVNVRVNRAVQLHTCTCMMLLSLMHVNAYGAYATKGLVCNKPCLSDMCKVLCMRFTTSHAITDYIVYFLTIIKRSSTALRYCTFCYSALRSLWLCSRFASAQDKSTCTPHQMSTDSVACEYADTAVSHHHASTMHPLGGNVLGIVQTYRKDLLETCVVHNHGKLLTKLGYTVEHKETIAMTPRVQGLHDLLNSHKALSQLQIQ